jgi:lysophospholipase L1-like esterase
MVLGADISTRRERPKGDGPYIPNLSTSFAGVGMTINSRGWRDAEYFLEKPAKVTRIMVIGDSVAFGYGVELEQMFPKVLERELNRQERGSYQVITLGGAGGNTYSQKNIIRDNVPIYRPDLVILAFNLNDIVPRTVPGKYAHSSNTPDLVARTTFRLRKKLDELFRSNSHLYFFFRERMKVILRQFGIASPVMLPLGAFDIEDDYGVAAWRDTSGELLEIASQLQRDKVRFLLAILPVDMQMSPQIADIYRREFGFIFADSLVNGQAQKIIADFARQHGIACVDLLPSFRENRHEKKFFRVHAGSVDWNHPNPVGHKIIAEELRKSLSSPGLMGNANGAVKGET